MSTPESWEVTPREFMARHKVREVYMAQWLAETRNASQFLRADNKPWTPDHFLKPQVNAGRTPLQQAADDVALAKARIELGMTLKGNPDMVPDWAKGPWMGPPKQRALNG